MIVWTPNLNCMKLNFNIANLKSVVLEESDKSRSTTLQVSQK
jgi:hypothetical protein